MNIQVLRILLYLILVVNLSTIHASDNPDRFLGPRDIRGVKSTIEGYIKYGDGIFRYGNWYGPGWWGGSTDTKQTGNKPPIDSLDAIAQKHDFGYQVAEQQGKIYGIAEEKRLKGIADYLAVRDAKGLPDNPKEWSKPPTDISKASRYRDRMITGFAYEGSAYENIAITGKKLDWVTSPIENWEMDKSHQLNADDLERQVTRLQNNWSNKNLTPTTNPNNIKPQETSDKNVNEPEKTNKTEQGATDKTDTTPKTKPSNTEQQKASDKKTNTEPQASIEPKQVDAKELENDSDYIELMQLSNEMMGLANKATAQANAGKIPSANTINRITVLESRISTLNKRLESKYSKKYLNKNKTDNKDKEQQNTGDRGGTVYNKDGTKDVLHYEKDNESKEVAVWTTYDKNGQVVNKRREK